jgi:hypothetical protein
VTKGYAIIMYDNNVRYAAINSSAEFSVTFTTCAAAGASIKIIGVDETGNAQSGVQNVTLAFPVTDVGMIVACGTSAAQFINYTLNSNSYSLTSLDTLSAYYVGQGTTNRYVSVQGSQMPPVGNNNISFDVPATGTGTFPLTRLSVQNYVSWQNQLMSGSTVTFTKYANTVGEFYEGTFNASFSSGASTVVHYLSGSFRLRRLN